LKKAEEVMEILEAYDLTGSLRAAAKLAGCDHKTVAHWVHQRELAAAGGPVVERKRPAMDGVFMAKIDELVDRSHGRIRADAAHDKLVAMGYEGSDRTTRRWVADAKRQWRREHGRRTRPWIPEPGLWMQWDYGDGPLIEDRRVVLFCAWLAWSRFRVVVPLWDKTLPSVVMGLDRAFRYFDGVPTYALTDNEKTVSVDHIAGIAVRNSQIVGVGQHYRVSIQTCVPADPQSKGGSEATVRIAKADLVPTDHNLRPGYGSMAELEDACEQWMPTSTPVAIAPPTNRRCCVSPKSMSGCTACPSEPTRWCSARRARSAGSRRCRSAARSIPFRISSSISGCGFASRGMS
jgi:transposase